MSIAFVVLHYMAVNDTIECVESIFKHIDTDDYQIIIIDNASLDDSWEILNKKYSDNKNIKLIHSNTNLGFARGNNLGYMYAKEKLCAKFIVLLNNDVCLMQDNIYKNIETIYQEYDYAVLGPMVVTKDGSTRSNPQRYSLRGINQTKKDIKRTNRDYILTKFYIKNKYTEIIRKCLSEIKKIFISRKLKNTYMPIENVQLVGAFLVFSPNYISKFDGLNSSTFLYSEEDILYLTLSVNELKSLYHPGITVYHKEDASTDESIGIGRKKKMFIDREVTKSLKIYLELLEKSGLDDNEKNN